VGIPVARSGAEASMSHAGYRSRILVVDDHPTIVELVAIYLRREGMEPVTCLDGRKALDALATESFDAVIVDVMMPDVTGYDVLAHIRSTPATAILPVVLLTAKAMPEDIQRGLLMGANHYIVKPFNGRDLVSRVRLSIETLRLGGRVTTLR
jgi:DNA-binding response OmpR family regulator